MRDEVNRLLGLEGFRVAAVEERGGALEVEVELVARAAVCPHCGRGSVEVKERPVVWVRDLSISGRWTWLRWRKRRFACQACRRTFTETHPELPRRRRMTRRFDRRLFVLARSGAAHAEIARNEGTSRYQVGRAFRAGASGELADRPRAWPRRISLDEAHHRRGHELATIVSDVDERRVIEVVDGRSRRRIERYLRSLPDEQRNAIEVVSIDPYEAYRQAVQTVLPDAVIVCDPFHLVRGANTALDTVRRERQRVAKSERGKGARRAGRTIWKRELYQARHSLLTGRERLTHRGRKRLCELFQREPLIAEAWGLKEAFRAIYGSRGRSEAEQQLARFLTGCRLAAIPSFDAFADGIRLWRQELLAYFDEPVTNGYAEGVINKIKVIKRRAYGLPTFEGFRRRVLVACG
jgi:transposase